VLECVVNISEGRDHRVVAELAEAAGVCLLDLHTDPDHNRSVLTLAGPGVEEAARAVSALAVARIDLRHHTGVHPRLGTLDVVPFVPLQADGSPATTEDALAEALGARSRFATWAAEALGLPCFVYGPERSLPEVRRRAFVDLSPDSGPDHRHPTAGSCAVGARPVLVAYNIWLRTADVGLARALAAAVRGPQLRALGLTAGGATQVSCNLVAPVLLGPAQAYDAVKAVADARGVPVERAELVGLAPRAVVEAVPAGRRQMLDLDLERTIEARLAARFG
jgi:glutamate formiminotransferase